MIRFKGSDIPAILYSLCLIAVPCLIFFIFLNPRGPIAPILFFGAITNLAYFFREKSNGRLNIVARFVLYSVIIAGTGILLVYVIITPYTAYLSWTQLVRDGKPQGSISYLIIMTYVYFSSIVAGSSYSPRISKPRALLTIVFICNALLLMLFQTVTMLAISIMSLGILILTFSLEKELRRKFASILISSSSVFIFALFFALLFTGDGKPSGSELVDLELSPTLRNFVISVFPEFPILYGIPGYGYSFESEGLGGTPVLSQRPLFEVSGEPGQNIYLRTSVFTVFDGSVWSQSNLILGAAKSEPDLPFRNNPERGSGNDIALTVLTDFYSLIPHTLETRGFFLKRGNQPLLRYGSMDAGYLLDSPLTAGETITIYERGTDSTLEKSDTGPDFYTQLPDRVSESVQALARSLSGQDLVSTIYSIQSYLTGGYSYTLNTGEPKEEDFINNFLFTSKKGYCVHFASAFTLLARLNGIQTRYVTGFLVRIPSDQNTTRVSGYSAHAWPEVLLPEKGWTIVEPTPPVRYIENTYGDQYQYSMYANDEYTNRQLRELIGSRALNAIGGTSKKSSDGGFLSGIITAISAGFPVIIAGILIVLSAILIIVRFVSRDALKTVQLICGIVTRRMEKAGIPPPSRTGWLRWGDSVKAGLAGFPAGKKDEYDVDGFIDIILRTYFGNHLPDKGETGIVKRFYRSIRKYGIHRRHSVKR